MMAIRRWTKFVDAIMKVKGIAKYLMPTVITVMVLLCMSGCYHEKNDNKPNYVHKKAVENVNSENEDRYYSRNYNFIVKRDSIPIIIQQPEETLNGLLTDTLFLHKADRIVVADIRILQNDKTDSVWVQVARDQNSIGWTHESILLKNVVPDDPISQFISTFSDTHLLIFLVIIGIIGISYLLRIVLKKKALIVHFNDIGSVYPTLLSIMVAAAATFYSSIQLFAPDKWQHFYFHPSLNPFTQPPFLGIFIASVWAILILTLATFDDVKNQLPLPQAALYLCGTGAICAANYIIFSIATLYYVGYVLLVIYTVYAAYKYVSVASTYKYTCGNCGKKMQNRGICPYCGANNK